MIQISLEISLNICTQVTEKKVICLSYKGFIIFDAQKRSAISVNKRNRHICMFDDVVEPTVEMTERSLKTSRKVAKAEETAEETESLNDV